MCFTKDLTFNCNKLTQIFADPWDEMRTIPNADKRSKSSYDPFLQK